jgi:FMN-dependent NADH-azoreductase
LFGASNPADVEETNMNLFRLDASISASVELAGVIEEEWTAGLPGATAARRDLGSGPLPALDHLKDLVAALAPTRSQQRVGAGKAFAVS